MQLEFWNRTHLDQQRLCNPEFIIQWEWSKQAREWEREAYAASRYFIKNIFLFQFSMEVWRMLRLEMDNSQWGMEWKLRSSFADVGWEIQQD